MLQREVDEPRRRHLNLPQLLAAVDQGRQPLGDDHRVHRQRTRQLQRQARRVLAVLRVLRTLHRRVGQRRRRQKPLLLGLLEGLRHS